MKIDCVPAENDLDLTKNIRAEKSRERFLDALTEIARRETFTNYFLSASWAAQYIARVPSGDFFAGYYLEDGICEAQSLAYFSHGTRCSPLSRGHVSLGFNEATSAEFESITTECNGILANSRAEFAQWIPALLSHILKTPEWEELRFNALSARDAVQLQDAAEKLGLLSHVFSSRKTYLIDLAFIRDRFAGDFLASRSANSRQQIRRAIKKIARDYGSVEIERASSAEVAHNWLDLLGVFHLRRWNAKGELTGFADPHFVAFHHSLIDGLFDSTQVDVLRVSSADKVLAYLHNFVVDGKVYFNLSGICYELFASYAPGILAHHAAIEYYQDRQMNIYNFLAGTNRYKESLSTFNETQIDIIVRRPLLKFRIEGFFRSVKRLFNEAKE